MAKKLELGGLGQNCQRPYGGGDRVMICPRCRLPFRTVYVKVRGGREYLYAYHRLNGKSKFCYLGPAGKYVNVEKLLDLDLAGLNFADYIEIMERAFDKALEISLRDPKKYEDLRSRLLQMLESLEPERVLAKLPKASISIQAEARA